MANTKAKKIPLIDKRDRWIVKNLAKYNNTLLSKEVVDFYQKSFGEEWQNEITRIFCNMTNHEAKPEGFKYWESIVDNKSTWFVEYRGRLTTN